MASRRRGKHYLDNPVLGDGTLTTVMIADLGVTTAKLGPDAVTTAKIADVNVTTAKVADDAITTPKMTLTIPITLAVSATLGTRVGAASDGVLVGAFTASPIDYAFADDGGSFSDETTAANESTGNDVTLLPATETTSDVYYFGQASKFAGIKLDMSTQGVSSGGGAAAILWQYWDGDSWETLEDWNFTDDSVGFTAGTSTYFITFTPPSDWAENTVNSQSAFWVRASCAVADYTTTPIGQQVWILQLTAGQGVRMTSAGTISAVQMHATTASAGNNDSVFLLVNITTGVFDTITWTKTDIMDRDATVSVVVALGDEVALMMVQEDGSTEFADASFIFELAL